MAITVNTNNNPLPRAVGKKSADATLIYSGFSSGVTRYEIRKRDGSKNIAINSNHDITNYPQILHLGSSYIEIILDFRTNYQVRVKTDPGSWSAWTYFKTRDKRYQSPDPITQITDDSYLSSTEKNNRTIRVTNSAKSTVHNTSRGATVYNSDKGYVSTTGIVYTSRGATISHTG